MYRTFLRRCSRTALAVAAIVGMLGTAQPAAASPAGASGAAPLAAPATAEPFDLAGAPSRAHHVGGPGMALALTAARISYGSVVEAHDVRRAAGALGVTVTAELTDDEVAHVGRRAWGRARSRLVLAGISYGEWPDQRDYMRYARRNGITFGSQLDPSDLIAIENQARRHITRQLDRGGADYGTRLDVVDLRTFAQRRGIRYGKTIDPVDTHTIARRVAGQGADARRRPAARSQARPTARRDDRRLYLAVGHGRTPQGRWDPGAIDPRTGMTEASAAQRVVEVMAARLRHRGIVVTAERGNHPNVVGSVGRANHGGYDDCVTIHQEWAGAPPGAFAHWYRNGTPAHRIADDLVGSLGDIRIGTRSTWHRPRPGLHFVRKSRCNGVLIELGPIGAYDHAMLGRIGNRLADAYAESTGQKRR